MYYYETQYDELLASMREQAIKELAEQNITPTTTGKDYTDELRWQTWAVMNDFTYTLNKMIERSK